MCLSTCRSNRYYIWFWQFGKNICEANMRALCTDHLISLHCKLYFVIAKLFTLAVGILNLLQMFHSLFWGQVLHSYNILLSQLFNFCFLFCKINFCSENNNAVLLFPVVLQLGQELFSQKHTCNIFASMYRHNRWPKPIQMWLKCWNSDSYVQTFWKMSHLSMTAVRKRAST